MDKTNLSLAERIEKRISKLEMHLEMAHENRDYPTCIRLKAQIEILEQVLKGG